MSTHIIKSVFAVFIFSLLISTSALAQKPAVMISTVSVDLEAGTMTITGKNFNIGPNPTTVTLGGFGNLNITSNNGTMIEVSFPEGQIPPGTYLLTVSSGPGPKKNAEQSITIGVQGPVGNPGGPGTPGDPGAQGPQGPQGEQGPAGPQGPSGATGLQGPQGAKGDAGTQGPKGDKGDIGDTGADGAQGVGFAMIASAPDQGECPDDRGVKYESGPDADKDGNPDVILFTNHVCDGEQGPQGIAGLNGNDGAPGEDGQNGAPGADGAPGAQGDKGDTGPTGERGEPGEPGNDGDDGSGFGVFVKNVIADCDGSGNPGTELQIFHDVNNNGTFEDVTDTELDTFTLCNGPQGIAGLNGMDGQDGAPGTPGGQGPPGMKGDTGDRGPEGLRGPAGADGQDGARTYTGVAPVNVDNGTNEIGLNDGSVNKDLLMWDETNGNWITAPPRMAVEGSGVDARQPYLVLNCFIATQGTIPGQVGPRPFIGEILITGFRLPIPSGWMPCDGQLMEINDNLGLFSILGTVYGGDGRTNFALPDLRGRVPIHNGEGPGLSNYLWGQKGGSETH